jgi:hypothetical protein
MERRICYQYKSSSEDVPSSREQTIDGSLESRDVNIFNVPIGRSRQVIVRKWL